MVFFHLWGLGWIAFLLVRCGLDSLFTCEVWLDSLFTCELWAG